MPLKARNNSLAQVACTIQFWLAFVAFLFAHGTFAQDSGNTPDVTSGADPCSTTSKSEISDRFCSGIAGWAVSGDAQNGSGLPDHKQSYIEASDDGTGGTWRWVAPQRYFENICEFNNGIFAYSIRQSDPEPDLSGPILVIRSNQGTLAYDGSDPPGTEWTEVSVKLAPGPGWSGFDDGHDFLSILANATGIEIRGEYSHDFDTGALNEVSMTRGVTSSTNSACSDLRPKFSYAIDLEPEPALAGGAVKFTHTLQNVTRAESFPLVTVDTVFSPVEDMPGTGAKPGIFQAIHSRCATLDLSTLDTSSAEIDFVPDGNDYGYRCEINYLDPGETHPLDFFQKTGITGKTDYLFHVYTHDFDNGWQWSAAPIEIIAGTSAMRVTAKNLGEQAYTGVAYEQVFIVSNTGNLNAVNPVLEIALKGDAIPNIPGSTEDDLSALRISSGLRETYGGETEACEQVAGRVHCLVVPDSSGGDPYLAPGESEQIVVSFVPPMPGLLSLSASAEATDYQGARIVSEDTSVNIPVEGPMLAIELLEIMPHPEGVITTLDGEELPFHPGTKLEPLFVARNTSEKAILVDGFFSLDLLDGTIADFAVAEEGAGCLSPFTKGATSFLCDINDFGPGDEMHVLAEIEYAGAVAFEASIGNHYHDWPVDIGEKVKGDPPYIFFYQTGARANPDIQVSFTPSPDNDPLMPIDIQKRLLTAEIASGRKIAARFSVKNAVNFTVGVSDLSLHLPTKQGKALYRPGAVTGCTDTRFSAAEVSCGLGAFDRDKTAEVTFEFWPVTDQAIGEKHCFSWGLNLPSGYVRPEAEGRIDLELDNECFASAPLAGGAMLYSVVPDRLNLEFNSIDLPEYLTAGNEDFLRYEIVNLGNISATSLVIRIEALGTGITPVESDPKNGTAHRILEEFEVGVNLPEVPGSKFFKGADCTATRVYNVECLVEELAPGDFALLAIKVKPLKQSAGSALHYTLAIEGKGVSVEGSALPDNIVDIQGAEDTAASGNESLWQFHNPNVSRQYKRAGFVRCTEFGDNSFSCYYKGTEEFPILLGNRDGDPVIVGKISGSELTGMFFTHPATDINRCPGTDVSHPAKLRNVRFSEDRSVFLGEFQYYGVNVSECTIYTDEVLGWYEFEFHRVE